MLRRMWHASDLAELPVSGVSDLAELPVCGGVCKGFDRIAIA